jgi:hypothetical protein
MKQRRKALKYEPASPPDFLASRSESPIHLISLEK